MGGWVGEVCAMQCARIVCMCAGGAMLLTMGYSIKYSMRATLKGVWGGWSGSRVEGVGRERWGKGRA